MAETKLKFSDGSASTEQAGSQCLAKIRRRNVRNASSPECRFQCSIVLNRFVSTETTREYRNLSILQRLSFVE